MGSAPPRCGRRGRGGTAVKRQRLTCGPWLIAPLSLAAWAALGIACALALAALDGGLHG
jgi:hypothetical protein